jgi:hypothetical protein
MKLLSRGGGGGYFAAGAGREVGFSMVRKRGDAPGAPCLEFCFDEVPHADGDCVEERRWI